MKIQEITSQVKPKAKTNRKGRGISAGRGKTAGRGTKGQNARSGSSRRFGFEGGQSSLVRSLPKLPGFKSHRTKAQVVYTQDLNLIDDLQIDNFKLHQAGLIKDPYYPVKLIVKGEPKRAFKVQTQFASQKAQELLKKQSGSFEKVPRLKQAKQTKSS